MYVFLHMQNGPSETKAALEFSINTLEVSLTFFYETFASELP